MFENTRVETTVAEHVFRTRGKVLVVPGWRGVYGELAEGDGAARRTTRAATSSCPSSRRARTSTRARSRSLEKETKPPRRYSDASLLGAMETAGKLVDDDELREAMKESGIGTPATRAAIIERLIDVGYVERDARALVPTEKGMNVIRLLGEHPLTSPSLTGDWEQPPGRDRGTARRRASGSWRDIAKFAGATVGELDAKLKDVRIPRANLGPVPGVRPRHHREPQGLLVLVARGPGLRLRHLEGQGRQADARRRRQASSSPRGRTEKPVTGFKGRSGRSFRARLALVQNEEGKWRVEFDEPWAKEGAKPPEAEEAAAAAAAADDAAGTGAGVAAA